MAPIYESDESKERWQSSEWHHYELWEKVEVKLKRVKKLWILATLTVFLFLSSLPVFFERRPKWEAVRATRRLGEEINRLKTEAGKSRLPHRIEFDDPKSLNYEVIEVEKCADPRGKSIRHGTLSASDPDSAESFVLLNRQAGEGFGIPGLVHSFCYDPLQGSDAFRLGEPVVGFAVIPAKDLATGRLNRMSILLLSGAHAEVSFE